MCLLFYSLLKCNILPCIVSSKKRASGHPTCRIGHPTGCSGHPTCRSPSIVCCYSNTCCTPQSVDGGRDEMMMWFVLMDGCENLLMARCDVVMTTYDVVMAWCDVVTAICDVAMMWCVGVMEWCDVVLSVDVMWCDIVMLGVWCLLRWNTTPVRYRGRLGIKCYITSEKYMLRYIPT